MKEAPTSNNGIQQKMSCPVCNTENELIVQHCKTCAWYFPLKDTPHFAIELSRAKQQFQMVNSFNQMYQHIQVQSKVLEKMSFRLDGLENELSSLKKKKPASSVIQQKYEYPELAPIATAASFDTPEKRKEWWEGLEPQWQTAFNVSDLRQAVDHSPTDKELRYILDAPTLRFVGPRGMHPSMDFELTNLSGVRHLTNLNLLVTSHQAFTDLSGIEHLENLESLFVNSNKLTQIREVHYLKKLKQLYINANQITDIQPVQQLTNLETLYCSYNQLTSLAGITEQHAEKLTTFYCLPNEKLTPTEIKRVEALNIFCKKG